jgi:hypothetical protein
MFSTLNRVTRNSWLGSIGSDVSRNSSEHEIPQKKNAACDCDGDCENEFSRSAHSYFLH